MVIIRVDSKMMVVSWVLITFNEVGGGEWVFQLFSLSLSVPAHGKLCPELLYFKQSEYLPLLGRMNTRRGQQIGTD